MKKNKVILSLIFVLIFAFSAFVLPACAVSCNGTPPSPEQTQGNNNNTGNNGNNGGTNNNSGTTSGNDGEEEHSDIVKKLMTDDYYISLMYKLEDNKLNTTSDMKPAPYKFLKQHGFNIQDYFDDKLELLTSSYIYENDKNHIYVSVKAENISTHEYGNYYSNYVLKYLLTSQEYAEYTDLCKGGYMEAYLFVQELDNQKTPEIISNMNIAVSTYDEMVASYSKWKDVNLVGANELDIDLYEVKDDLIKISIKGGKYSTCSLSKIAFIKITPTVSTRIRRYDNNAIYFRPGAVLYNNKEEDKASLQNITSFGYLSKITNINPFHLFDFI